MCTEHGGAKISPNRLVGLTQHHRGAGKLFWGVSGITFSVRTFYFGHPSYKPKKLGGGGVLLVAWSHCQGTFLVLAVHFKTSAFPEGFVILGPDRRYIRCLIVNWPCY